MSDLYVREHSSQKKTKENCRTLSFIPGEADFYPEDFLTQSDTDAVYFRIFAPLMERLYDPAAVQQFKYRDVSLLACFKKVLFEYVYAMALRVEVLQRVSDKILESVWLEKCEHEDVPYLGQVIAATPLSQSSKIKMFGNNPASSAADFISAAKRPGFNWGPWKNRSVAVYSDPRKCQAVLKALGSEAFLYLNEPAPRTIAGSIWDRVPLYCPSRETVDAQTFSKFVELARSTQLFKGLVLSGIHVENPLYAKLETVLKRRLSSLIS